MYHDDVRDSLIAEAAGLGTYSMSSMYPLEGGIEKLIVIGYERARGSLYNDITSFHPDQRDWSVDRAEWPSILHQFKPTKIDLRKRRLPTWMTRDGRVILDINDDPVLDYNEIPTTVSSKLEAPLMEAICRSNMNIHIKDIRARMLRDPKGGWNGSGRDPVRNGNLSMSMTRFRAKAGLLSWGKRDGSQALQEYMEKILPQACKDANSTKNFRDLHPHEMAEMRLQNVGRFPERSRMHQDHSETRKEEVKQEAIARIERLKQRFQVENNGMTSTGHDATEEDLNTRTTGGQKSGLKKRKRGTETSSDEQENEPEVFKIGRRRSSRTHTKSARLASLGSDRDIKEDSVLPSIWRSDRGNKEGIQPKFHGKGLAASESYYYGHNASSSGDKELSHNLQAIEASQLRRATRESLDDLRKKHEKSHPFSDAAVRQYSVRPEDLGEDDSDGLVTVDKSCSSISHAFMSGALQLEQTAMGDSTESQDKSTTNSGDLEKTSGNSGHSSEERNYDEENESNISDVIECHATEESQGSAGEELDNDNFLYLNPRTWAHQTLLHHLLEPTRRCYYSLTGQNAPFTNMFSSYISQFGDIQMTFNAVWNDLSLEGPPPLLTGIIEISPGEVVWNCERAPHISADVDRLMGEVFEADN